MSDPVHKAWPPMPKPIPPPSHPPPQRQSVPVQASAADTVDASELASLRSEIATLKAGLKVFQDFFKPGLSDDGQITYMMTMGRLGIQSNYWAKKPLGQGAALSVGTETDRYGIYAEVEKTSCPDAPTTGIFAHVCTTNPTQRNIGLEVHVDSAPNGNIVLLADGPAIEVGDRQPGFYVGKSVQDAKRLWP